MKIGRLQKWFGLTRIAMGWIFFWSFLDKTFGLMATAPSSAWLTGASPTTGFLENATRGPFADIFQSMAGSPLVDWLFMLGLLGIGTALILGIGVRIACWSGAVMSLLMWLAVLPPDHNPILDYHVIYALVFALLLVSNSGKYLGFGKQWQDTTLVKKYDFLA
ncbi:MAG: hypothetical protein ABEJ24_05875 [Candidatus Magasanikbacteria bacterium]